MRRSSRAFVSGALALALASAVPLPAAEATPPPPAAAARSAPLAAGPAPPDAAAFRAATRELFENTCEQCHNSVDADGGFDVSRYTSPETLRSDRERWERILSKLESREMPPSGIARPEAQIADLVRFLQAEFARADASIAADPGRVAVRRLNRTEYTNTIRDLLGVEFRAEDSFPADDSGEGFDNIADVLTVSPLLMEKYLAAAEQIAARAVGGVPLPQPVRVEYLLKLNNLRRLDASTVQAKHRSEFDAEYELQVGMRGRRPAGAKPVQFKLWVDGKLVHQARVPTAPSAVYSPTDEQRVRVPLTQGEHTFRAAFVGDDFVKTLGEKELNDFRANKWIEAINIEGPYPSTRVKSKRRPIFTCDPNGGAACVKRMLGTLAQRAYRRPVSDAELGELTRFVDLARAEGETVERGVALALEAMLVSPHFLFHIERDPSPSDPSKVHRISDVELASRLSYFLWSSMPDDELLDAAIRGRLKTRSGLDAQVARMLRSPKAAALAQSFAGQWLEIRNLDQLEPDPDKFPLWSPDLRDAMKTETELFFSWVLQQNRSIADFLDARYTFLDERLAKHYGIPGVSGPDFRRVALTTEQRGGILGHGSVLAVSSYPTRTSVVIRGKYVLQNLLGSAPPPPPPDVPALDEQAISSSASLREQMELHRSNAVCASCHARMDPLGFALENYDAIGRWRAEDGGTPVDASGVLPSGEAFRGPAELRRTLKGMLPELGRCLTEKMLTYALGRGLQRYDKPTVRAITERLAASGYRFQSLVYEIVHSLPFQSRRGEDAS